MITSTIPLGRLLLCAPCEVAFEMVAREPACPRCGSELGVWPVWRWLNGPGVTVASASANEARQIIAELDRIAVRAGK